VGQVGAGQEEVVGVSVSAEFGQRVQIVTEELQLLAGFF
jgi:hypothetical protein